MKTNEASSGDPIRTFERAPRLCIVQHTLSGYNVPLFERLGRTIEAGVAVFATDCDGEGARRVGELGRALVHVRVMGASRLNAWMRRQTGFSFPSLRVVRAVWTFRPQVVFVDGLSSVGTALVLRWVLPLIGGRIVWWSLGAVPGRSDGWRARLGDALQWLGTRGAIVLSYGTHGANYFRALGVPAGRVITGCNTIDETEVFAAAESARSRLTLRRRDLGIGEGDTVIVYCGALGRSKRVDVLLRAFADSRISSSPQPTWLMVIGEGEERAALHALAAELGVESRVRFVGARSGSEVSEFFLLGQFAVLPGLGGLAIPHAFAHGLPVVCGPADGTERDLVVNGRTGILLATVSAASLADAMHELLTDPEKCLRFGAAGRELVRTTHSIDVYCQRVLEAAWLAAPN